MLRTTVVGAVSALLLASCGGDLDLAEERLITDREIEQLKLGSSKKGLATTEVPKETERSALVRINWGYLGGKKGGKWVNWTGGLKVNGGGTELHRTIFFDGHDKLDAERDDGSIRWKSKTGPHFDGLIVRVWGNDDSALHIDTPLFDMKFPVAKLEQGLEEHFVVNEHLHEVSITAIPGSGCGFALGYHRPAAGWLGFGGKLAAADGKVLGHLRFRSEDGQLFARLKNGREIVARGSGRLRVEEGGGSFEFDLTREDGSVLGTVRGLFREPSYSDRGFYQAGLSCPE